MWIYHFAETLWASVRHAMCCERANARAPQRTHLFDLSCLSHSNFLTESTQCLLQLRKQRAPDSRCNRSGTMLEPVFVWFLYTHSHLHTLNSFAVWVERAGEREREYKRKKNVAHFQHLLQSYALLLLLLFGGVCLILCVRHAVNFANSERARVPVTTILHIKTRSVPVPVESINNSINGARNKRYTVRTKQSERATETLYIRTGECCNPRHIIYS